MPRCIRQCFQRICSPRWPSSRTQSLQRPRLGVGRLMWPQSWTQPLYHTYWGGCGSPCSTKRLGRGMEGWAKHCGCVGRRGRCADQPYAHRSLNCSLRTCHCCPWHCGVWLHSCQWAWTRARRAGRGALETCRSGRYIWHLLRRENHEEHHRFLVGVVHGLLTSWRRLHGMATRPEGLARLGALLAKRGVTMEQVAQEILGA